LVHTVYTCILYIHTYIHIYVRKHMLVDRQLTSRNWGGSDDIVDRLLIVRQGVRGSIPGKDKRLYSYVQDNFPMGTIAFPEGGGEAVGA
jgi:hypothetical protein